MRDEESTEKLQAVAKAGLAKVADWLEAGTPHVKISSNTTLVGFEMSVIEHITNCGTVCCIAGALQFLDPAAERAWKDTFDTRFGSALFMPPRYADDKSLNDPARAARVIRNFIANDIVDWNVW